MPGCKCDISKILSYNESNNTLTIKGDLVVEGNGSQAAIKMGSSAKPANLWVIGGLDIGDIPGYANTGDLRVQKDVTVGTDLFVNNKTILGATVAPSNLPDKHLYLNGSMDIGDISSYFACKGVSVPKRLFAGETHACRGAAHTSQI